MIAKFFRMLCPWLPAEKKSDVVSDETYDIQDVFATLSIHLNVEGQFQFKVDIDKEHINDEGIDSIGSVLWMLHSGHLTEFCTMALRQWSLDNATQVEAIAIAEKWLEYQAAGDGAEAQLAHHARSGGQSSLAVPPTEVFGLKNLRQG